MAKMSYPKLELGLSLMSKDHLANILTYNSLKVCVYYSSQCFGNYFKYIFARFNIHFSYY
jgi:hypothetical protein